MEAIFDTPFDLARLLFDMFASPTGQHWGGKFQVFRRTPVSASRGCRHTEQAASKLSMPSEVAPTGQPRPEDRGSTDGSNMLCDMFRASTNIALNTHVI